MRMAHCKLLLLNKHGVWNERVHEEMKSWWRNWISTEEGTEDEEGLRDTLQLRLKSISIFIHFSLRVCMPYSDISNLCPNQSENVPKPASLSLLSKSMRIQEPSFLQIRDKNV